MIKKFCLVMMSYFILLIIIWYYTGYWIFPKGYQAQIPVPTTLQDRGIFTHDTDDGVTVIPSWLSPKDMQLSVNRKKTYLGVSYAQHMLAIFPIKNRTILQGKEILKNLFRDQYTQKLAKAWKTIGGRAWRDYDHDGIPNGLDIQLGMQKVIRNHASYLDEYVSIPYPMGDVDRRQGVCTDVLVRTFRNAGIDLQRLIYEDMKSAPLAYGLTKGQKPNPSIDHRRVRRLIVYFKRHYRSLPTTFNPKTRGKNAWLPGDILFMSLQSKKGRPGHVGLVSPYTLFSTYPMVTNNLAHYFYTANVDFMGQVPMMYRFRL